MSFSGGKAGEWRALRRSVRSLFHRSSLATLQPAVPRTGGPVGVAGGETVNNSLKKGGRADKGQADGSTRQTEGATLYVELRRDGQPINPLLWMAASTDGTRE